MYETRAHSWRTGITMFARCLCERSSMSTWTPSMLPWSSVTTRNCAENQLSSPGRANVLLFVPPRMKPGALGCARPCQQCEQNNCVLMRYSLLQTSQDIARSRAMFARFSRVTQIAHPFASAGPAHWPTASAVRPDAELHCSSEQVPKTTACWSSSDRFACE